MSSSEARVVVVSENVPLIIGLTLLRTDWDVTSQTTITEVAVAADVLVLDLGTTQAGLAALAALDDAPLRVVLLGDEPAAQELPATTDVLVRPFTLPELAARIDGLLRRGGRRRRRRSDPAQLRDARRAITTRTDPEPAVAPADPAPQRLLGRVALRPERARDTAAGDELFQQRDQLNPDATVPPPAVDEPELVIDLTDETLTEEATREGGASGRGAPLSGPG